MPKTRPAIALALAVAASLLISSSLKAAEMLPAQKAAAEQFEPAVKTILARMCATLGSMRAFAFDAEILTDKVYKDGSKVQFARNMAVRVKRPDQFLMTIVGDDQTATSVYDGRTFTLFLPKAGTYATVEAPGDIDSTLEFLYKVHHLESPLGELLLKNPCTAFKGVSGYSLGKGLVGKTVCDHLFIKSKDFDWQLWVEEGDAALPRKLVITEKRLPMVPQFVAFLNNWRADDSGPIAFVAPAGARQEDSLATLLKPKK